jgi:hypothetical protein
MTLSRKKITAISAASALASLPNLGSLPRVGSSLQNGSVNMSPHAKRTFPQDQNNKFLSRFQCQEIYANMLAWPCLCHMIRV